jgi:mannose-6-phosphate isomerase-like protein (cupin superfamily)
MEDNAKYSIHLDEKYGPLKVIDVPAFATQVKEGWFNQTLCQVNDCLIRVGVFKKGEFHWHRHDKEDEFFFVLSGKFKIEIEKETVVLGPHQGYVVPKGTMHKTSVNEPTVILMMEAASVKPTGD